MNFIRISMNFGKKKSLQKNFSWVYQANTQEKLIVNFEAAAEADS